MKKKIIFLSILIGGILPFKVKAMTGSIAVSCDKDTLEVGQSTNCKIVGTSDEEVTALSFLLKSNEEITISDVVTSSDWQGDGKDKNVALYTDENKKGTFSIATFKLTANKVGTGNVYTEKLLFASKDFQNVYLKDISMNMQVKEKSQSTLPSDGDEKPSTPSENKPSTGDNESSTGENTTKPNGSVSGNTTANNTEVKNPKTGVYTVGGVALFSVAVLVGIALCKKKNYFSKI